MHRDVKLGLSLGILLVGIVGALFLRREPEKKEEGPPPLQNAGDLDKLIAEKPNSPHLTGVEEFTDDPAPPPSKKEAAKKEAAKSKAQEAYKVPQFLSKEDEAAQRDLLTNRPPTAPDPIQPNPAAKGQSKQETAAATPAPVPAHNRAWETAPAQGKSAQGKSAKNAATAMKADKAAESNGGEGAAPVQTHVIQAGDTLSGLASRYLGSGTRYREIYEANQNVLRSPNDLPEGVTITIPARSEKKTATPVSKQKVTDKGAEKATEASSPGAPEEAAAPGNRFKAVHRTPFSAGRIPKSQP